jgi:hypothetical protein
VPRSISPDVHRFVTERIHSVAQLELLLMLHRDPPVEWTAEAAAREMRYPTDWAAAEPLGFRRVDELAEAFTRRRSTVTALISPGPARTCSTSPMPSGCRARRTRWRPRSTSSAR